MSSTFPRWRGALTALILALLTVLVLTGCRSTAGEESSSSGTAPAPAASGIDLVDDAGREVHLDGPAQRAAVISRYNNELIRAMGSIDNVVTVDKNTAQDRAYWPQFSLDEVFSQGQDSLNLEQLVAKDVDVLVVTRNGGYEEIAKKVEPLGIDVVVVTGWDNARLADQMTILGKVFDNPAGAQKVTGFFEKNMTILKDRLAGATPKSVYWEYGDPNTTAIPGTSNDGWHQMILAAGGSNIFAGAKPGGKTIDPEKILQARPQVVIKTTSGKALKNTGVYTPPDQSEMRQILAEMAARPGWVELPAVKKQQMWVITGFAEGGLGKMVGAVYLATWLHPERMRGVDPEAVFAEWMRMQGQEKPEGHHLKYSGRQ